MICPHCVEQIRSRDQTRTVNHDGEPALFHLECVIRPVVGSAAHQLGDCRCNGGTREDPPDMTKRQCALLAYDTWRTLRGESVPLETIR